MTQVQSVIHVNRDVATPEISTITLIARTHDFEVQFFGKDSYVSKGSFGEVRALYQHTEPLLAWLLYKTNHNYTSYSVFEQELISKRIGINLQQMCAFLSLTRSDLLGGSREAFVEGSKYHESIISILQCVIE